MTMAVPGLDGPNSDHTFDAGFGQSITRRADGTLAWSTVVAVPMDVGSPELHARASTGEPLATGGARVVLIAKTTTAGTTGRELEIDLFNVTIAKLVSGSEPSPVDNLFLTFTKMTVKHSADTEGVTYDLTTGALTPSSVSSSDLTDAFNFNMGGGTGLEVATSFTGPSQTPGGSLIQAAVDPKEADQNDAGLDRRPTRLWAFLKGVPISAGHVHVYRLSSVVRAYDMTNIRFASVNYTGTVEKLAFSVDSMTWTVGNQQASFP
jgi:type VI protein secretion system component Hcp